MDNIIEIEILVKLTEYNKFINFLASKIYYNKDTFLVNILKTSLVDTLLDNKIKVYTPLYISNNIDNLLTVFESVLDSINETYKYTVNTENNLSTNEKCVHNVYKTIKEDIDKKMKELMKLHIGFHTFPKIRIIDGQYAILKYEIGV